MRICLCLVFVSTVTLGTAFDLRGDLILGNLSGTNFGSPVSIVDDLQELALRFQTGGTSISLTGVTLRLGQYGPDDQAGATIGLLNDVGGSPGSLIGSYFNNPASTGIADDNYLFTAPSSIALNQNTSYWLFVGLNGSNYFDWDANLDANPNPSSPYGVLGPDQFTNGAAVTFDNQANWTVFPYASAPMAFQLQGNASVPEPSSLALSALGASFWAWRRRRRKRQVACADRSSDC